jgi:hypothetical protein
MGSCQYVVLYGAGLNTALCAHFCDGDYCPKHKNAMDAVDELDHLLQQIIRENRKLKGL